MLLPELLVLVPSLGRKLLRPCNGRQRATGALELLQLSRSARTAGVDAVHFDSVSTTCDMQSPDEESACSHDGSFENTCQFHAARTVRGWVFIELSQQRHTISTQPSTSHGKSISQVRQLHLCFFDRRSRGTAYQLNPPSAESSTRSGQRPPPE